MDETNLPAATLLRQLIRYDSDTGKLFWLERTASAFHLVCQFTDKQPRDPYRRRWNTRYAEQEAFTTTGIGGYKEGAVCDVRLFAHQVIWALQSGSWPAGEIDHINGIRTDNTWVNLRLTTKSGNCQNASRRSDNKSGITGVFWNTQKQRWFAVIHHNGKHKHLGSFCQFSDAALARKAAEADLGFHPNHGRQ
ncbi:HNH endonuclease [Rhizobium pusense]|uniref:HNH endonuclease signature motif containing protein n=1 Tax=Agrobacterium pusense TaxID=648995 RepID=UPI00244A9621|nr:HNH endonuclease signature motif containing protein [Agrobacterium pusense]MDH2092319.1 HNH endonuclease [Agrobacterium pusense]